MSEESKKIFQSSMVQITSDVNEDNLLSVMTEMLPSAIVDLQQGSPSLEQGDSVIEEPLASDLPGADNCIITGEYYPPNDILDVHTDMNSIEKFVHRDQNFESPVREKVFEVPLLNNNHFEYSSSLMTNANESVCEGQSWRMPSMAYNDVHKDETNSDSTVEYSLDEVEQTDVKHVSDENLPICHSAGESFSPLPSTSSDYITMNINDIRFNKVIGSSHSELSQDIKDESTVVKVEESDPHLQVDKKENIIEDLSITECSSGSDEVVICGETKPNIIDLSDDVKSDSDCEIIDVDNILNENEKILNMTQISHPATPRRHNVSNVVNLSDSVEILSPPVEIVTPLMDSVPLPINLTESAEINTLPDNHQAQTPATTPPPDNYYPLFSELKTILSYLGNGKTVDQNGIQDLYSNHNYPMPPLPHPSTDSQRRKSRRIDSINRKRRRLEPVIDLSVTSTIKPNSSSDVIVIDVDSPVSMQRTNNVAQISVSIVGPMSTSVENHVPACDISTDRSNVTVTSSFLPTPDSSLRESSAGTPPRPLGDCPVCLENFSKVKAVSTFCGHLFCIGCITKVKTTSKKCPTCRKQLKGKGYHPIFL